MKAIMYHYVRDDDPDYPYFKNLHLDDFKAQLDFFASEYGFVSQADFNYSLLTGEAPEGVILTFDDGLKDHFNFVLPTLIERGLWGIFYIPTFIFRHKQLLDVHRVHVLLGKFRSKTVYQKLLELFDESMLTHSHVNEFKERTYIGQVDDDYTKIIKRTLNYYIGYQYREQVMRLLMAYFFPDEEELFNAFYLTPEEVKRMDASGMVIGSHTINHPVMAKLPAEEQRKEIEESFHVIANIIGEYKIKTFCYPYGGFHSFNPDTERILDENSCAFAFNVESRDITKHDLLMRPQALPRYDCNELPFGQCRQLSKSIVLSDEIK
jgi:peptidoglycan/xylan/chitin deacetylase (PgdA/CDA1 family)